METIVAGQLNNIDRYTTIQEHAEMYRLGEIPAEAMKNVLMMLCEPEELERAMQVVNLTEEE